MFCPKCGKQIEEAARYCPGCGAELPAQTTAQHVAGPPASSAPPRAVVAPAHVAAAPTRGLSRGAIIAAICAVIALVLAAVFMLPRMTGGFLGGQTEAVAGVQPAVMDGGTRIQALPRPTILDLAGFGDSSAVEPSVGDYKVSSDLSNVTNVDETYLSDDQKDYLVRNGFVVEVGTGGYEFYEQYEMNRYAMLPSFVTVDSMMHTYHLYFSHLMKNAEKEHLSSALASTSREMLNRSADQLDKLEGTEWESAAKRNLAFFAVGACLLDPSTTKPSAVSDVVEQELALIDSASSMEPSPLFSTDSQNPALEDYTQYKPRGYYAGDETLERYFRAMMWYGRANFTQKDEDLDRSALLMTMALQDETLSSWESIYSVTSFFAGASDDCGYYEYRPIIDEVYGADAGVDALVGDEAAWTRYHALTAQMPAPQINSVVVWDEGEDADHEQEQKGFRFMGQRFTIDAAIMQNLVYNKVGENNSGDKRMMPDALDVPAALGSDEALSILEERGATGYSGYTENLQQLRDVYTADDPALWQASLYAQWLYTLNPLLEAKGAGYPEFMQSSAWARKSLQSYLGSYTELKHDTVLYSKQVMVEMGGGVEDRDDRGYVEPEPQVYERLAKLTAATSEGLSRYGMLDSEDAENLNLLRELSEQLQTIAQKELQEEALSDAENELIRSYGGQLEHFWQEVYKDEATSSRFTGRDFPAAVVVDVATNPDAGTCLELGTGKVSKVWVAVPVDGKLRIAIGAVYSFYQFEQPASERLTDTEWREQMGIELPAGSQYQYNDPAYHVEDWTRGFQYERETY